MPVRVLVVDDSPSMRALIRSCLERDHGVRVVGEAADPFEAREAVKSTAPDVITLDINMPRMDGLDFLERLMRLRPTPVIMISSEAADGGAASIAALEMGAFDCILKPASAERRLDPFPDIAERVRAAAEARIGVRDAGRMRRRPTGRATGFWGSARPPAGSTRSCEF